MYRVARLRVAARGNRPCAKGVATPPRCQRRTTFPSAAFGLRSAWRQVARNKKTTQKRMFGAYPRGWCIEHVLSQFSFLHLRENAFLVPCTQTARPFLVFLKDLSSDAPEKKKEEKKRRRSRLPIFRRDFHRTLSELRRILDNFQKSTKFEENSKLLKIQIIA